MFSKKSNSNRIEYLDFIKAISILLVVFCHSVTLNPESILGNIFMTLAWAACPLFFMAAGAVQITAKKWNWKKYFYKLAASYITLTVWKALYLLIYSGLKELQYSKAEGFLYLFLFNSINNVPTGHLWFMYTYIMLLLLLPIIWHLYHSGASGKKALLFTALIAYLNSSFVKSGNLVLEIAGKLLKLNTLRIDSIGTAMPFGNYPHMIVYFILGAFLHAYEARLSACIRQKMRVRFPIPLLTALLSALGLLGLLCIKYYQTGSFRWMGTYLVNGYYWSSTLLLSVSLYMTIQHTYKNGAVPGMYFSNLLGTRTQAVYYLHIPVLSLLEQYVYPYLTGYYSFALNLCKTVLVTLVCLVLAALIKKIPVLKRLV